MFKHVALYAYRKHLRIAKILMSIILIGMLMRIETKVCGLFVWYSIHSCSVRFKYLICMTNRLYQSTITMVIK
jgi:hypothetical protein